MFNKRFNEESMKKFLPLVYLLTLIPNINATEDTSSTASLVSLINKKKIELKHVPESVQNLYKNYILSQRDPYNARLDLQAFIQKMRLEEGVFVKNETDQEIRLQIKYESKKARTFFNKRKVTLGKNEFYIPEKQEDALITSVKILNNNTLFINPKYTEDGYLQLTVEETQDRHFLHQYHSFDFTSKKFTVDQLNDMAVADAERQFRNDYNGSCDYMDYVAKIEGLSLSKIDEQRRTLYAHNNIASLMKQDPELLDSTVYRTPLITHKIWTTSDTDPKNPSPQYIKWLENSIKHNMPSDGWTHYFWIESVEKLPELARLLKDHPTIILRELSDLDTTQFVTGDLYKSAIKERKFGKATDILRLEILRLYGGYYLDTDYELFQSLLPYSKAYDLVVGLEPMSVYLCNAFIGACTDHPSINKALEMINRNLSDQAPDYIKFAPDNGFKTIIETGPAMFTLAVALSAGKDTQDIVLPPQTIYPAKSAEYPKKQVVTPDGQIPAQAIGAHYWNTAWMDPQFGSRG
jgi:Glycosyltransferase sugar-binding region containing DXD motif